MKSFLIIVVTGTLITAMTLPDDTDSKVQNKTINTACDQKGNL